MPIRFAIIGGGPAGNSAATHAARLGGEVTLIERDVIGGAANDYAINVQLDGRGEPLWFAPELLEFVDHAPGTEIFDFVGIAADLKPRGEVKVVGAGADGARREFQATVRIDTPEELVAFRHGGILPYVVRQLVGRK